MVEKKTHSICILTRKAIYYCMKSLWKSRISWLYYSIKKMCSIIFCAEICACVGVQIREFTRQRTNSTQLYDIQDFPLRFFYFLYCPFTLVVRCGRESNPLIWNQTHSMFFMPLYTGGEVFEGIWHQTHLVVFYCHYTLVVR